MKAEDIFNAAAAPLTPPAFTRVPIADVLEETPPPPTYWWAGLVPAGAVTLWSGHGGSAKSFVGLMLGSAIAAGRALFGETTRCGRVAYYSAEDPSSVTRHRLHLICRGMGLDPAELDNRLHVLDATIADPVLFHDLQSKAGRHGTTTPTFEALREYMAAHGLQVLIVDNASDAFDGSEIDRSRVRAFMRTLRRLVPDDGAVILLAHVDKGTSRGERPGTESYSGSTAWHNSARSRIAQSRDKDGALLLDHQKNNYGAKHAPIRLIWPSDGIPTLDAPLSGTVRGIAEQNDTRALLQLIDEFSARGEFVSAATTSRTHAGKLLRGQPGFPPRMHDHELFDLLRVAERRGLLARVDYKGADRKLRERWEVTPEGRRSVGLAATAATSRDFDVTAHPAGDAEPAATAATSPPGGVGGKSAHNSRSGAPA